MFDFTNNSFLKDIVTIRIGNQIKDIPFYVPCKKKEKTATNLANKRLVDTNHLMEMLDCGKHTAIKIGNLAGAKVCIERKLFWNVKRIQQYLDSISE